MEPEGQYSDALGREGAGQTAVKPAWAEEPGLGGRGRQRGVAGGVAGRGGAGDGEKGVAGGQWGVRLRPPSISFSASSRMHRMLMDARGCLRPPHTQGSSGPLFKTLLLPPPHYL